MISIPPSDIRQLGDRIISRASNDQPYSGGQIMRVR